MRRWLAFAALALAAAVSPAPTFAQAEPLRPLPDQAGYAFDQPRVLVQQRLLGLAHGVSLLVSACMDRPQFIDGALGAYGAWREDQEGVVREAQHELARHYFGRRAGEARWPDLLRALNLRNQIDLAPDSVELAAACTTLPQALSHPRYDLARQFRLHGLLAEATAAIEAELRRDGCKERLEGTAAILFEARYAVWHEINAERIERAMVGLALEWPADAPADSLAQWRLELRRDTRMRGRAEDCLAFSETLKRPQVALRQVFAPPPEP